MACDKKPLTRDKAEGILYAARMLPNRMRDKVVKRKYYCKECEAWHLTSESSKDYHQANKKFKRNK